MQYTCGSHVQNGIMCVCFLFSPSLGRCIFRCGNCPRVLFSNHIVLFAVHCILSRTCAAMSMAVDGRVSVWNGFSGFCRLVNPSIQPCVCVGHITIASHQADMINYRRVNVRARALRNVKRPNCPAASCSSSSSNGGLSRWVNRAQRKHATRLNFKLIR